MISNDYLKTRLCSKASFFLLAIVALVFISACERTQSTPPITLQGNTMGTTYSIVLPMLPDIVEPDQLQTTIDALLVEVNRQMSTYIPDSEISTFNRLPINEWMSVSSDFIDVVSLSLFIAEQSNGQFDISVGPLVELWGFGNTQSDDVPSDTAIAEAKSRVGWQQLIIDVDNNRLSKNIPLSLNLSAIAKGFGVDKIAEYLLSENIDHFLVEIGGEMRVKGVNPRQQLWKVGIEKPSLSQQSAQEIISLDNKSIATSGDYRNYFEDNGQMYSHTINPKTGKPVRHNIASVTVIAETAAEADGFATALNVMGINDALALAEKEQLPAYFILYDNDTSNDYRIVYSSVFKQYLTH